MFEPDRQCKLKKSAVIGKIIWRLRIKICADFNRDILMPLTSWDSHLAKLFFKFKYRNRVIEFRVSAIGIGDVTIPLYSSRC